MEEKILEKQIGSIDGHALPCLYDVKEEEDNDSAFTTPEFNASPDKMTERKSLSLNSKHYVDTKRCIHKFPLQCQSPNTLTFQRFVDLDEDLALCYSGYAEFIGPQKVNIVCTASSPPTISVRTRSSKYSSESLKLHRRTRSANMYSDLLIHYTSAFRPRKAIISPLGKWVHEENDKMKSILKGPLFIHLNDVHAVLSSERVSSFSIKEMKLSELTSSAATCWYASPQNSREERVHIGEQRSGSEMTDQMFVSCSSAESSRSYQSELSDHISISKGLLHCVWKDENLLFLFSVSNELDKVYTATPWKVTSPDDKALEYMYLFHERTSIKKGGNASNLTDLVGKMKVSSCLSFNTERSIDLQTEFVLYGVNEEKYKETKSSSHNSVKSKGVSRKFTNLFRSDSPNRQRSTLKPCERTPGSHTFLQAPCLNVLDHLDKERSVSLLSDLKPNLELAAIVIKDRQTICNKGRAGGWGLKFLENRSNSLNSQKSSECCSGVQSESAGSMNVLIPAGYHSRPTAGCGGPSSLTERWTNGGHCDCGGWDVGCPLTILSNQEVNHTAYPRQKLQEDCTTFDFFVKGGNQDEPAVKVLRMHEGLYAIYFQSTLLPLQSFSIAVAIIHSRSPALYPKL